MADIKNFGIKGLSSDVQLGKGGGRFKYDSSNNRFDLTQSDGSTLENLRLGAVTAGAWNGTAIAAQYGGLGGDNSSSTGIVSFSSGTASVAAIDLSDGNLVDSSSQLPVAQGGTGASTAGGARTNLGLGTVATQDSNNVSITGGTLNGVVIGGSTAAAGSFTTINASGTITGDLTGDVTGTVSDISNHDTDSLSEGSSNLYFTNARARSAISVTDSGGDGSLAYNSSTGVITYTGPSAAEVRAHFSGGTGITITNGQIDLDDTAVTAASYGSSTAIPVITVDQQGRITAASTASISTSFTVSDGSNTQTIDGGDTLTFSGTANEVEVSVGATDTVTIGLPNDVTVSNNLTVSGSFLSDDITASAVSIAGDATITGNLTVQGTQTTVNSTTVETADAIFRVNSNGTTGTDVGFEANVGGNIKQVIYDGATSKWTVGSETFVAATFEGDLTGDVTGTVSDISNHDTDSLSEGSSNLYHTTARARGAISAGGDLSYDSGTGVMSFTERTDAEVRGLISVTDAGGDGSLAYNSSTGVITYTGPSAAEVRAHFSGGTGLTITNGQIDLDDTAVTAASYGSSTAIPVLTIDQQGRITAASTAAISTSWTLTGDTGSETVNGGDTVLVAGGTNITTAVSATDTVTVNLDSDISLTNVTISDTFTDGTLSIGSGEITGAGNITASGAVTGDSLTDGTATLSSGSITGGVAATFSGAVTGGSLTDGTATLSSGALTGATNGTFSGTVTGGTLTDGTLSASSGAITGATNITASGTVQYGSLSDGSITINGFVDEDNMASDSASLVPTQQSVKAYVDAQLTAQDLDIAGDSGTGAVDLDSQSLAINGGTGLTSSASGQAISIGLDNTAVTAGSYGAADTVGTFTVDAQGRLTAAADVSISITNSQVSDFNAGVDARVSGGTGLTYTAGVLDLDDTAVTPGSYGSSTAIPVITVDQQGRLTAASTASISTSFTVSDGSNTQTVDGGDTLTIQGTANEVDVVVGATDTVTIGLPNDVTIGNNLTVTGSFLSDDITSSSVSISGDAVITGNLTVQGTQTTVNSTTVETADAIFRVNSNGTTGADVGFEANVGGSMKQIVYTGANSKWSVGSETFVAATFEGDLTGDVTGTVSDISNHDTDSLSEGSSNLYFTNARARGAVSVTDAGGDGSLSYDSSTGVITYTGPSQAEVLAHISGGTGVSVSAGGVIAIGQAVATSDDVTFNNVTASANFIGDLTGDVTGDVTGNLTGNVTGDVSFGTLTDSGESIAITKFVDEADGISSNDNDTTIPTSAAVKDYVDNNGGEGLVLRASLTSGSTTIDTSNVPNISSRTYYAEKIVVKIGTAFSGGNFNHILIKENGGSGTTLCAADDADAATAGTYIIELDGEDTLTKNAAVQIQFFESDGSTASTTTAGSGTCSVYYRYA